MMPPTEALRTPCVPGCSATIEWLFDEGERQTWDYPGYPESVEPYQGCDTHIQNSETCDQLVEMYESQVWDLVALWELLLDSATYRRHLSQQYLSPIRRWYDRG